MKIVNPNAVYLNPNDYANIYQFIEKVGRTCYKSEDRINNDSAKGFVSQLVKSGHWAMLEHGYVYIVMHDKLMEEVSRIPSHYKRFVNIYGNKMTASLRGIYELLNDSMSIDEENILFNLFMDLSMRYPEVFGENTFTEENIKNKDYILLTRDEFINYCVNENNYKAIDICLPHTILFTVNRGVTHELVRHRLCAFGQESTRYCNYGAGKFGNEITVVAPFWLADSRYADKKDFLYKEWLNAMNNAEIHYMTLLNQGAIAQEARTVLPISVKNDIVVTATEEEWRHIINLRVYGTTGKPHPDMRLVMIIAAEKLRKASNGRLYEKDYTGLL